MRAQAAARLLFPARCPVCGRVSAGLLCPECKKREENYRLSRYRLAVGDYAFVHLAGAAALYGYKGPVSHAVRRMKYNGEPWRAAGFGHLMAARIFGCNYRAGYGILYPQDSLPVAVEFSGVVPVPPGRPGVHIPGLLAKTLANDLHLPVWNALYKSRPTPRQEELDREGRKQNLWGSFALRPECNVEGKNILLVDDVITTGTTLSACSYALLQAGAESVFGVCAAAVTQDEQTDKR